MHTEMPNKCQSFITELQTASKPVRFDIKSITTYGVLRLTQLENISHQQIRQQTFKQLVAKTLKVCHLYDPILQTLQQQDKNIDLKHPNPNTLLRVNSILKILYENLFYRHMVKLKIDNSDVIINLVNNRSTELNRKVLIAGIIVYISKRLSLQEIGTVLLMYNLQENLIKLKPYGLPLQQGFLQKCLKKIERILSNTDLKNFISAVKEEGLIFEQNDRAQHQISGSVSTNTSKQYLIGPDHFLYLVALSEKKTQNPMIFFHNFNTKTHAKTIEMMMERKKTDNINNQANQQNTIHNSNHNNGIQNISTTNYHSHQNKQNQPNHSNFNSLNSKTKEKVRGLTLYQPQSAHIKNINHHQQIYQQIKDYLKNNNNLKSNSLIKQKEPLGQELYNNKKVIEKQKVRQYRKSKSVVLLTQMNKNRRPSSAIFKKSIQLYQNNKQFLMIPKKSQNLNEKMTIKSNQTFVNKFLHYRSKSHCINKNDEKNFHEQKKLHIITNNKDKFMGNYKKQTEKQKVRYRSQTNYMKITNRSNEKSYQNFKRSQTAYQNKNSQKKTSNNKIEQFAKATQNDKDKTQNIYKDLENNQSNFDLQFYHPNNTKYFGVKNTNRLYSTSNTSNIIYKNHASSSNIQGKFSKTVSMNPKKKETIIRKNGALKIKENRMLKIQNKVKKSVRIEDKQNSEENPNIQIHIIEQQNQQNNLLVHEL